MSRKKYDNKTISVFPNPTADEVTLVLNNVDPTSSVMIHFFDSYGRLVKQVQSTGKSELILNFGDLPTQEFLCFGFFIMMQSSGGG